MSVLGIIGLVIGWLLLLGVVFFIICSCVIAGMCCKAEKYFHDGGM